jgi:NADP-dependent 3-hydroxy acid dehydrogenase YdfG
MTSSPPPADRRIAVVTGASSGIGAATARQLAAAGFDVVIGARRTDRLAAVAAETGARWHPLDVCDDASVAAFCATIDRCDLLVNNAGGALGLDRIEGADLDGWRWMYEANVLGTLRMTKALLPALEASGRGHVVIVGSVAAFEPYPGGAGYNGVKAAELAFTKVLRLELMGRPIRVTEIDPGMVETEFSLVRFGGDTDRAAKVYDGVDPLTGDDIATCITWCATLPDNLNIDQMVVRPRAQATARDVYRRPQP